MNTFRDVIQQLVDTNQKLLAGSIDVKVANQVAINTQTIINAAKVQIEVMKLAGVKASDFFKEPLEPIDKTLKEIEESRKKPYESQKNIDKIIANAHK